VKIGELANVTGVSRDALRLYERCHLISAMRNDHGHRVYAPETVQLVAFIRTAQKLGLSLSEISQGLPAVLRANRPDQAVEKLLADKVKTIGMRIEDLQELKQALIESIPRNCPLAATK